MEFIMWVVYGFCIHLNFNDLFYWERMKILNFSVLGFCIDTFRSQLYLNCIRDLDVESLRWRKFLKWYIYNEDEVLMQQMLERLMIDKLGNCWWSGPINWLFTLPHRWLLPSSPSDPSISPKWFNLKHRRWWRRRSFRKNRLDDDKNWFSFAFRSSDGRN